MSKPIDEIPEADRPREKLLRKGAAAFAWKDPKTGPEAEMQLNPFAALSKLKPSGH